MIRQSAIRIPRLAMLSLLACTSANAQMVFPLTAELVAGRPAAITASHHASVPFVSDDSIRIDGDLSDWPAAAPVLTATSPSVSKDLSATARVAASSTSLYLAWDVTDDAHVMRASGDQMWQWDSVQFALDPLGLRTAGHYGTYDYELGMCQPQPGNPVMWRWQRPPGVPGERVKNAQLAVKLADGKAFYEARIPLAEVWPLRPEAATPCGFAYVVNDRDDRDREAFAGWASGIGSGKDPSAFGLLEFEQPPSDVKVAGRFLLPFDPLPSSSPQHWDLQVYAARAGKLTVMCVGEIEHGANPGASISARAVFDVPAGVSRWKLSADLSRFAPARLLLRPTVSLDGTPDAVPPHPFTVYVYTPS